MAEGLPTREQWRAFERRVATRLVEAGGEVLREPSVGGARLDLVAQFAHGEGREPLRIGVEVHYYRRQAGRNTVQPFLALMESLISRGHLDGALLVVNSGFVPSSFQEFDRPGIGSTTLEKMQETVSTILSYLRGRPGSVSSDHLPRHRIERIDPSKQLFVMMPFHRKYLDTFVSGIVPAADDAGLTAFRADQIVHNRDIMQVVRESIVTSHRQLAVTTDANANVLYELGFAHALRKEPILAANNTVKLPFDIANMNHILYSSPVSLRNQLPAYL